LVPFVAAKITLLGTVTIITISYPALALPEIGRAKRARRPKMNPHNPTETSPGKMYARDDLLRQEAHSGRAGRMARWVRTIARVAFVLLIVGILAATVVGPGRAIDWVGSYLVPVAVKLGVITAVLALLVG
jgi:hypothetical protein